MHLCIGEVIEGPLAVSAQKPLAAMEFAVPDDVITAAGQTGKAATEFGFAKVTDDLTEIVLVGQSRHVQ